MIRPLFYLFAFLFMHVSMQGQTNARVLQAKRIAQVPKIDGSLTESCWNELPIATDFTQQQPNPGKASRMRSEIRIGYDDEALYIGARLFDTAPDSILHQFGVRDDYQTNTDAVAFYFDPYHDRRNAFFFAVTAAGVQTDSRFTLDKSDESLNSVWYSQVKIDGEGWVAELKIPFASLRFPKDSIQVWGFNAERIIRRYREVSFWNPVDPAVNGIVNQCGDLNGIANIISPLRLAFLPYVSGYAENFDGENAYSLNGGMDIKYGLNESFTLDMTLIPDFGQTISDNVVLNLSPFEVKFDERRYFFTEGTELFNKNDLFYSRRIGARPSGYNAVNAALDSTEYVVKNPATARLYNATKISGRTPRKTGIGFFNAVSAPAYARIGDFATNESRDFLTEPLTNYNVLVVDQILKNNSYVGLLNTNVMRAGHARDANVTSFQFRVAEAKNKFAVEGYADMSALYLPGNTQPKLGRRYSVVAGKVSGRYTIFLKHALVDNRFDPNDLGYQDRNNYLSWRIEQNFNTYKPFWRLNRQTNRVEMSWSQLYTPRHYTFFNIEGRHFFTFRNFHTCGLTWLMQPIKNYDYFETRTPGRYLIYPKNYEAGAFLSSDYRRRFALDMTISYRRFLERNRTIKRLIIAPRIRVNDRLFLVLRNENELKKDNVGFGTMYNGDIVFGVRDLTTITNIINASYIFTSRMSLSLRVRHYWSKAQYTDYFALNEEGKLTETDFAGNLDVNFNAFNIDLIYVWQFLPGSELSVVWKNSILNSGQFLPTDYFNDVNLLLDSPQSNSFSFKLIYFLDANKLRKKK